MPAEQARDCSRSGPHAPGSRRLRGGRKPTGLQAGRRLTPSHPLPSRAGGFPQASYPRSRCHSWKRMKLEERDNNSGKTEGSGRKEGWRRVAWLQERSRRQESAGAEQGWRAQDLVGITHSQGLPVRVRATQGPETHAEDRAPRPQACGSCLKG